MKYLIVGLGNIGSDYENTRHNIGFDTLDALAKEYNAKFEIERHAMISEIKINGRTLVLAKPTTFMNLSGKAVKYWMQQEKIPLKNVLVICDDIDLPVGKLRIKAKGGAGSHNGLTHIMEVLNTKDYNRLRFGIGKNYSYGKQVDYVLGPWKGDEEPVIAQGIGKAIEIVKAFVTIGIERTMNFHN
ncbi:MAG: aminoacyl-tRNA hydrolase [Hyphomicrobiales bacterium]